ncbi:hypothetical protein Francci3_2029 [Frankia casuarinae]|uniref:Uncharacterized protein n=2 Tax=Frankiaceae TaxID=74712 RepID=Q2JBD9_FRACC|nr:hypothetical protein Francci3_2029 [Frankia casuarinae]
MTAKPSQRVEQDELRARMRAVGMSHDEIAIEFARRYHYRPRAAHRHARGWTQTQAANHINAHAARAGLDPDGAAPMTEQEIHDMVTAVGDIVAVLTEADPADKAEIYTQLGLQLTYEPGAHRVIAEAKPQGIMYERECPRGDLNPHAR